jgi:CPA2 family monovalent cation:H+ antiporter-2
MGVRVVNLRRANGQPETVSEDTALHPGDTLVLSGKSQTLAVAEEKLLRG